MGWERFSTTPQGYGVTGGAARLSAGQRVQVIACQIGGPAIWCLVLQSDNACTFQIDAGNGQAVQTITQAVKGGRHYLTVVAEAVTVNAQAGAAACAIYASAAPDNGPQGSPTTAAAQALTLVAATVTAIEASGRVKALIHNNTAAALTVLINGVDCYRIAAAGTLELNWAGAFELLSTPGGSVNVVELFQ